MKRDTAFVRVDENREANSRTARYTASRQRRDCRRRRSLTLVFDFTRARERPRCARARAHTCVVASDVGEDLETLV